MSLKYEPRWLIVKVEKIHLIYFPFVIILCFSFLVQSAWLVLNFIENKKKQNVWDIKNIWRFQNLKGMWTFPNAEKKMKTENAKSDTI